MGSGLKTVHEVLDLPEELAGGRYIEGAPVSQALETCSVKFELLEGLLGISKERSQTQPCGISLSRALDGSRYLEHLVEVDVETLELVQFLSCGSLLPACELDLEGGHPRVPSRAGIYGAREREVVGERADPPAQVLVRVSLVGLAVQSLEGGGQLRQPVSKRRCVEEREARRLRGDGGLVGRWRGCEDERGPAEESRRVPMMLQVRSQLLLLVRRQGPSTGEQIEGTEHERYAEGLAFVSLGQKPGDVVREVASGPLGSLETFGEVLDEMGDGGDESLVSRPTERALPIGDAHPETKHYIKAIGLLWSFHFLLHLAW